MLKERISADKTTISYIMTVVGSTVTILADFIQYLTTSYGLFVRSTSIFQLILETIDDPETMLGTVGDKIALGIIIVGIVASVFSLCFALTKKMKAVIVFSIIASIPFLMFGRAWIHYLGIALSIIGAVWYRISIRKGEKAKLIQNQSNTD